MFKKKKKAEEAPVQSVSHDDLIIHNMPSASKLGASVSGATFSAGFQTGLPPAARTDNSKTTGLLIMAGGIVVIAGIFYLSYRFMIRPAAEPVLPAVAPSGQNEKAGLAGGEEATSTPLETATSTDLTGDTAAEVATTTPETAVATSTEEVIAAPEPVADSDEDGLSDPEESVFGTDPLLADSDGDTYSDAMEITGGYDPRGAGKLSGAWARHENNLFGYTIDYPAGWSKQELGGDAALIFTAPDDSLVQVTAEENVDKLSILSWYEDAFPGSVLSYDRLKSGAGWEGIMSDDGLNFYVTDQNHGRLLVISYISSENRVSYPFIFSAMIRSLSIK